MCLSFVFPAIGLRGCQDLLESACRDFCQSSRKPFISTPTTSFFAHLPSFLPSFTDALPPHTDWIGHQTHLRGPHGAVNSAAACPGLECDPSVLHSSALPSGQEGREKEIEYDSLDPSVVQRAEWFDCLIQAPWGLLIGESVVLLIEKPHFILHSFFCE